MDIITWVVGAIGLIGSVGGAVGYFAKARGDSIIAYQEKMIKNRDDEIARLLRVNEGLTKENSELSKHNTSLQKVIDQGITPVKSAIDKLGSTVTKSLQERNNGRS